MGIFIGTPAFGGKVDVSYLTSLLGTVRRFCEYKFPYHVFMIANESLINRARNKIANHFLKEKKEYQKLLFIDADMAWKFVDIQRLYESDKPIVGGTCPLKSFPIGLVFNVYPEHGHYFSPRKSLKELIRFRENEADEKGEIAVKHLGAAFMMIDRNVLEHLKDKVEKYSVTNLEGKKEEYYEFFPVRVKNGVLESEDYAFCSICQENGFKTYLNTHVLLDHTGFHTWSVE